jgi:hypothetical protein
VLDSPFQTRKAGVLTAVTLLAAAALALTLLRTEITLGYAAVFGALLAGFAGLETP